MLREAEGAFLGGVAGVVGEYKGTLGYIAPLEPPTFKNPIKKHEALNRFRA